MTVANTTARNQYTATAGQTVFAYSFEVIQKEDIAVEQNGTLLSEGTDFTLSGVGNDNGGNVTLTTGATAGDIITIYRDMALERETDYQASGSFLADDVDDDFDRLWLALQQEKSKSDLAIRAPINDTALSSSNTELANVNTRANKVLGFDNDGLLSYVNVNLAAGDFKYFGTVAAMQADDSLEVGDVVIIGERANSLWDVIAATTNNGYDVLDGTGSGVSLQIRADQRISVYSLGVKSDGSTDDTPALQRVFEFSAENNIKIEAPKGNGDCLVSSVSVTGKDNIHIEGNLNIRATDNTVTSVISLTSCDNPQISLNIDLGVTDRGDTWGANVIPRALSFNLCNNVRVYGCTASDGYIINPSPSNPGNGPISDEVLIAVLAYTEDCVGVRIERNNVDGVDLAALYTSEHIGIHENRCGNDTSEGGVTSIFQNDCTDIKISDNDVTYINITGRGGFFFGVGGSRIKISDNTGYKIAGTNNGHAVYQQDANNINISNNIWIENGDISARDCTDVVVDGNIVDATDGSNGTIYSLRFEGISTGVSGLKVTNNYFSSVSGVVTGGSAAASDVKISGNTFNISRSNYFKYLSGSISLTNLEIRDNKASSSIAKSTLAEPFIDFEGQTVSGTVRIIDNTHIRENGYGTKVSGGESFEIGLISNLPANYELRGNGNQYIMPSTEGILEDGLIGEVTYTEVTGTVNDPDTSTPVAGALQRLDDLTCTVAIGGQVYKIEGASIDFTEGLLSTGGIAALFIDAGGGITPTTNTTFVGLQLLRFNRDGTYPKVVTGVNTSYASPRSRLKAGDGIQLQELTAAPSNIVDGLIIYADGTSYNPGSGEGFYGRENGAWVKL